MRLPRLLGRRKSARSIEPWLGHSTKDASFVAYRSCLPWCLASGSSNFYQTGRGRLRLDDAHCPGEPGRDVLCPPMGISEAGTGESLVSHRRSGGHDPLRAPWSAVSRRSNNLGDYWANSGAGSGGHECPADHGMAVMLRGPLANWGSAPDRLDRARQ
jgi:hypothetical protein